MTRSKFTEQQIAFARQQAEGGSRRCAARWASRKRRLSLEDRRLSLASFRKATHRAPRPTLWSGDIISGLRSVLNGPRRNRRPERRRFSDGSKSRPSAATME
jgi:hypothetical protein